MAVDESKITIPGTTQKPSQNIAYTNALINNEVTLSNFMDQVIYTGTITPKLINEVIKLADFHDFNENNENGIHYSGNEDGIIFGAQALQAEQEINGMIEEYNQQYLITQENEFTDKENYTDPYVILDKRYKPQGIIKPYSEDNNIIEYPNQRDNSDTRTDGILYPLLRLEDKIISQEDIISFKLYCRDLLPEVEVVIYDTYKTFEKQTSQSFTDHPILVVKILPEHEIYRSISLEFFIHQSYPLTYEISRNGKAVRILKLYGSLWIGGNENLNIKGFSDSIDNEIIPQITTEKVNNDFEEKNNQINNQTDNLSYDPYLEGMKDNYGKTTNNTYYGENYDESDAKADYYNSKAYQEYLNEPTINEKYIDEAAKKTIYDKSYIKHYMVLYPKPEDETFEEWIDWIVDQINNEKESISKDINTSNTDKPKINKDNAISVHDALYHIATKTGLGFAAIEEDKKEIQNISNIICKQSYEEYITFYSKYFSDGEYLLDVWVDLLYNIILVDKKWLFKQKLKTTDLSIVAFVGLHGTSSNTIDTIPKKTYRVLTNLESQISSMSNLSFINYEAKKIDRYSTYNLGSSLTISETEYKNNVFRYQKAGVLTKEYLIRQITNPKFKQEINRIYQDYATNKKGTESHRKITEFVNEHTNYKAYKIELNRVNFGLQRGTLVHLAVFTTNPEEKNEQITKMQTLGGKSEDGNTALIMDDIKTNNIQFPSMDKSGLYYINGIEFSYEKPSNNQVGTIKEFLYLLKVEDPEEQINRALNANVASTSMDKTIDGGMTKPKRSSETNDPSTKNNAKAANTTTGDKKEEKTKDSKETKSLKDKDGFKIDEEAGKYPLEENALRIYLSKVKVETEKNDGTTIEKNGYTENLKYDGFEINNQEFKFDYDDITYELREELARQELLEKKFALDTSNAIPRLTEDPRYDPTTGTIKSNEENTNNVLTQYHQEMNIWQRQQYETQLKENLNGLVNTVKKNSDSDDIKELQNCLNLYNGKTAGQKGYLEVDGKYGKLTNQAVDDFINQNKPVNASTINNGTPKNNK